MVILYHSPCLLIFLRDDEFTSFIGCIIKCWCWKSDPHPRQSRRLCAWEQEGALPIQAVRHAQRSSRWWTSFDCLLVCWWFIILHSSEGHIHRAYCAQILQDNQVPLLCKYDYNHLLSSFKLLSKSLLTTRTFKLPLTLFCYYDTSIHHSRYKDSSAEPMGIHASQHTSLCWSVLFTFSEFLDACSFYSWEYRWTLSDKKGGSKISIIHDKAIPTPIVARTAKHRISRRATLTTELSTFIPTSIPRRATLSTPTELPSFVQYNHINMQSTDIAQQATPMLAHTLARALPSELSSSMHSTIASCPSQHPMSLLTSHKMIWNMSLPTQKMIWNSAYWTWDVMISLTFRSFPIVRNIEIVRKKIPQYYRMIGRYILWHWD